MQAKKNGENPEEGVDEVQEIEDEEIPYLHLEAGGANSIVGRSGITRKSKKNLTKNDNATFVELEKVTEKLAEAMEEKMHKKLRKIFERLGELNPGLNIDVEELCAESSANATEDRESEDGEEVNGDEGDADEDDAALV